MRLLLTAPGLNTRAAHKINIFALDQARALREAGHEVRIAAIDTRSVLHPRRWGTYCYEIEDIPVYYSSVPVGRLNGRPGAYLKTKAAEMLWKTIDGSGWMPEVVHAHFGSTLLPFARKKGIATVYTEHSSKRNRTLPPEQAEGLRRMYQSADVVIGVSHSLADRIRENTGVEVRVVPNCAACSLFECMHREHGGFRFVSTGNLVPIKNFPLLLRAFAGIRGEAELVIFGSGEEEKRLRALCGELGITKCVSFRGRCSREELADTYAESDCFVLPSVSETFGVAYIEAMAAGLPVIATRCGGPEDFVTPETRLLIPTDDAAALTEAMESMMRNAKSYDAEAISAYVRSRFSPEVIARRLTEIYEGIVK